jgi:hypothetical protein
MNEIDNKAHLQEHLIITVKRPEKIIRSYQRSV